MLPCILSCGQSAGVLLHLCYDILLAAKTIKWRILWSGNKMYFNFIVLKSVTLIYKHMAVLYKVDVTVINHWKTFFLVGNRHMVAACMVYAREVIAANSSFGRDNLTLICTNCVSITNWKRCFSGAKKQSHRPCVGLPH